MSNKEVIEQLESLKAHCESMKESGEEWEKDVQALNYAIKELERTAQEVPVQEIIENQIEKLIDIQEGNKNFRHNNCVATCLAVSTQINELLKIYLEIKKTTTTK